MKLKNIAQTLFASAAVGSGISFLMGANQLDRNDSWPGAMLMAVSVITLLGTGIAVKLLYFRDE
jgi:hypothetical protein